MYELVVRILQNNDSPLYLRSWGEPKPFLSGKLLIPCGTIVAPSGISPTNKPHVLELGTKSQNVRLPQLSSYFPLEAWEDCHRVWWQRGLVYLGLSARHSIIACNPLINSWQDLPLLPTRLQRTEDRVSTLFLKVVMVNKSKRSCKITLYTTSVFSTISKTCYSLVYTSKCLEWIYKEHNYNDLSKKRSLHVCVDDVNSNLAHALVFDLTRQTEVEIVTFNAEAMIWTPWGYDDILVHNHPSCIARKSLHHYRSRWDGVCGGGSYFFSPHRWPTQTFVLWAFGWRF